jgi:general secretion pathway protein I
MNARRAVLRPVARQTGFSLIEMVAAFVVFALGMGVLMGILSSSIRAARLSADYTQAALWAQTGLDTFGIGEELHAGHKSGKFDNDFRWELEIAKYEPPPVEGQPQPASGTTETFTGIELYRLDLTVFWGDRRNARSAIFSTLRAVNPNLNNASGLGGGGSPNRSPPGGSNMTGIKKGG